MSIYLVTLALGYHRAGVFLSNGLLDFADTFKLQASFACQQLKEVLGERFCLGRHLKESPNPRRVEDLAHILIFFQSLEHLQIFRLLSCNSFNQKVKEKRYRPKEKAFNSCQVLPKMPKGSAHTLDQFIYRY
jgi:hypothetical protein